MMPVDIMTQEHSFQSQGYSAPYIYRNHGNRRQLAVLAAKNQQIVKWKAALWSKDSIEPAMLR